MSIILFHIIDFFLIGRTPKVLLTLQVVGLTPFQPFNNAKILPQRTDIVAHWQIVIPADEAIPDPKIDEIYLSFFRDLLSLVATERMKSENNECLLEDIQIIHDCIATALQIDRQFVDGHFIADLQRQQLKQLHDQIRFLDPIKYQYVLIQIFIAQIFQQLTGIGHIALHYFRVESVYKRMLQLTGHFMFPIHIF